LRRVLPSEIVVAIDRYFGPGKEPQMNTPISVAGTNRGRLEVILSLLDSLPDELRPSDNLRFLENVTAIRTALTMPENRHSPHSPSIRALGADLEYPLAALHRLLSACPDEVPSPGTAELAFISDEVFRNVLRTDLSAVNRALVNGEWKAATVLSGSIVEALLLSALQKLPKAEIDKAVQTLRSNSTFQRDPGDLISRKWSLVQYVEVASDVGLIESGTKTAVTLATGFRDLIHPAKEIRDKAKCNRATALSAVAAIEHVINDLTSKQQGQGET
jgi:hypothetical protein